MTSSPRDDGFRCDGWQGGGRPGGSPGNEWGTERGEAEREGGAAAAAPSEVLLLGAPSLTEGAGTGAAQLHCIKQRDRPRLRDPSFLKE
eukprot:5731195-Pyramimonas_sp.AAC.1